jgi:periplasmic divalent cation tolerance protein
MTKAALVLTTIGADADAEGLARQLVDDRLAACVTIGSPMISVYRWKGAIERSGERPITIKTRADRLPALQKRLLELHPYELPEFLVVSVDGGSEAYLEWIESAF